MDSRTVEKAVFWLVSSEELQNSSVLTLSAEAGGGPARTRSYSDISVSGKTFLDIENQAGDIPLR